VEESRDQFLRQEGWTRQFIANEPRLSEAIEMYREAGFKVHLEPLPKAGETPESSEAKGDTDCRQCFDGFEDQYKIIFTKPGKNNAGQDDALF